MSIKSNPLWLKMEALRELCHNNSWSYAEHKDEFIWGKNNSKNKPTDEEIEAKRQELISGFAMKLLRSERDRRLTEVDWWSLRSLDGVEMTQKQKDYRKALRDLPATANPDIDDKLKLINVTWPTKPE